ncbi:nuclease [Methylobacterium durans]|uniref:thermonuclease family protein n=1 Tax=Methylobacterium durans TaxID=2202825 RepID=UPI002B003A28|nr:nuclease [Methylobacterium durans]MEA1831181.1 nuclease [Methylobacterium durans]
MNERPLPESASSLPTADERARLRARIRAAIEAARPQPVALRTLELLAQAAVEPDASPAGYRIVDPRTGAPRLRERQEEGAAQTPAQAPAQDSTRAPADEPLSLDDLVAELRRRHPALFLPEPERVPEPPAAETEPEAGSDVKAATARFVETQSVLAKSLVATSSARGRALAARLGTSVGAFRERLDARRAARTETVPETAPEAASGPARAEAAPEAGTGMWRERLQRARERLGDAFASDDLGRRRYLLAGLGAVILAVGAAALVTSRQEPSGRPSAARIGSAPGADTNPAPAPGAASQTNSTDPENRAAGGEAPPAPPANPNEISGPAEVIDTATLRVGGKLVRLFGVEWVRGGQAEDLTRYLAGRTVTCQPVTGSQNVLCQVEGRDLSEVVLFNGGGRASPEATPDLVAAEDHARSERLGVWKR